MADDSAQSADPNAAASGESGAPAPAASPTTPAVDLNALMQENERLKGERATAVARGREAQQRAAALERQLRERRTTFDEPPAAASPTGYDPEVLADVAEVKFKLNHPDWNRPVDAKSSKTVWDEMTAILMDDTQVAELVGNTPSRTLNNIYREVQYRRMLAERKAQQAAQPRRTLLQAQAEMSGQGANTPIPTIDISDPNMTADQFLDAANKAGMLDDLVDPNDPPSFLRNR